MDVHTKFAVRSFTRSEIIGVTREIWALSGYAYATFSPNFLTGFCSDIPCECTGQI